MRSTPTHRRSTAAGRSAPPDHGAARAVLRTLGIVLTLVGAAFALVGFVSFFGAMGGGGRPQYFWCAFVGLPMVAFGLGSLRAGYLGSIARYVTRETAPVAKETIGYLAHETQDAVRTVSGAISQGVRGAAAPGAECPQCRHELRPAARFCDQCGAATADRTCSECRGALAADARYCPACGAAAS